MDEFKALAAFAGVVEAGSFRRAAVQQGLAPQAVSKTVRQLEDRLGVRLLHRTTRKLSMTEEGARLFAQVQPGIAALRHAVESTKEARTGVEGVLRVTASRSIGLRIVVPLIEPFMAEHPDVRVELELEDRITDLVAQRIDVGFRVGAQLDRNYVARRLADIRHCICASPGYIERFGRPRTWADLARHRCTGFRHVNTGKLMPWEYLEGQETAFRDVPAVFSTNDVDAEVQAVLTGIGIGQLPGYAAMPLIQAGLLVQLLPRHTSERIGLYVYYLQGARLPARARAFIDFASARLKDSDHFSIGRARGAAKP
ncbi:LysR family transcriptional regulator [Variovorax sp. Sphag1AA]|uniref:LysR family transcriptional regulator n=1 Tax=Variovorax sp. Sphag1AA TaxID=2587027 RepID=UPI0016174E01|nr:LysR family transcriptional regulator [Variovorax sp. Sphag1AA]MBB3178128.1 DNA-binding transcriptional LysR family regulator [Variovorax sp. Sphag1AA]